MNSDEFRKAAHAAIEESKSIIDSLVAQVTDSSSHRIQ